MGNCAGAAKHAKHNGTGATRHSGRVGVDAATSTSAAGSAARPVGDAGSSNSSMSLTVSTAGYASPPIGVAPVPAYVPMPAAGRLPSCLMSSSTRPGPPVFDAGDPESMRVWLAPHIPLLPSDSGLMRPIVLFCAGATRHGIPSDLCMLVAAYYLTPRIRFDVSDVVATYVPTTTVFHPRLRPYASCDDAHKHPRARVVAAGPGAARIEVHA